MFCIQIEKDPSLIAYWDAGSCGPYGNDYNWEWCDTLNGGPCKKQVITSKCRSGIAKLISVKGNEFSKRSKKSYRDPKTGCYYMYFATYACTGNPGNDSKYM